MSDKQTTAPEDQREAELDCGDSSCQFAKNKGGMRTNGGCTCYEKQGFHRSAIRSAQLMLPEIVRLRAQLAAAEKERDELRDGVRRIETEASGFEEKWGPRLGNHPLVGFACDIELRARALLASRPEPTPDPKEK